MGVSHHGLVRASGADATSPSRLLDQVRERLRRLGMARRTEQAYCGWIRRFVLASGRRHPRTLGAPEVEAFLTQPAAK